MLVYEEPRKEGASEADAELREGWQAMSGAESPLHVLCIDDDQDILSLLELSLKQSIGADVTVSLSGAAAIELFCEGLRPDVILLDADLGAEDGQDVAARLTAGEDSRGTPVIMVSGGGPIAAPGAIGYIKKPFDPMTIGNEILRQLAEANV